MDDVMEIMRQMRRAEFERSPQLSLGALLDRCQKAASGKDADCRVVFDFEYAHPTCFGSYRGIFSELSVGFEFDGQGPTIHDFIADIKQANGTTFHGWKGGDYTMGLDTPVWVANQGNAGSTGVVGVRDCGWQIVIETAYIEA